MSSQDHQRRYDLWQEPMTRRRFLSDSELTFDKTTAQKLNGFWSFGTCDYKAAGVSESDFNKYREIRKRFLDWEQGVMAYLYKQEDKWKELCKKYKLSDLPYDYKPEVKRDDRKQLQQIILQAVKDNTLKKKPLLAFLRTNNPDLNPSAINRQLNKLLKCRALDIDTKFKTKRYVIMGAYFSSHYIK
ncbi:hypothetical protein P109_gp06 [Pelagibacter phage HTVC109P]|nr:hypothetical protein P109_gp06 [Pelagibacter phage HTVC109P]